MDPVTLTIAIIGVVIALAALIFQEPIRVLWAKILRLGPKELKSLGSPSSPESKGLLTEPEPLPYLHLRHSTFIDFIGRDQKLAELMRALQRTNKAPLVVVYGMGGVGKTSLVLEAINRLIKEREVLRAEERFDAFIWISAELTVYTADGPIVSPNPAQTLEDVFASIAVALRQPEISNAVPTLQQQLILDALSQQRTLLIIDNFEDLTDTRVRSFIEQIPPTTKAIVTTRSRIDGAVNIHLKHMERGEARDLIRSYCKQKHVVLSEDQVEALYRGTDGLPLAISYAVAQMSYGSDIQHVLNLVASPKGEIATYLFETSFELARKDGAHLILLALSFFATDGTCEGLHQIAAPSLERGLVDECLTTLNKLSLVEVQNARYSMRPMTRRFVAAQLSSRKKWETDARERWSEYLSNVTENSTKLATQSAMHDYLEPDRENLVALFEWASLHEGVRGCHAAAAALLTASGYFYARGFWAQLLKHVPWASRAFLANGSMEDYIVVLLRWPVRVYLHWGDTASILRSFEEARRELDHRKITAGFERALVDLYWASIARRQDGAETIVSSLQEIIEIFDRANRPRWTAAGLIRLADAFVSLQRYDDARGCFNRVLAICSAQVTLAPWIDEDTSLANANLGIIDNAAGEYASAQKRLASSLPRLLSVSDKCILSMELAIAEYHLGHVVDAKRLGTYSKELAARHGFKSSIGESDPTWEREILPYL